MSFVFEPTRYVNPGHEQDAGEWADETLVQLATLRSVYPELKAWGNLALGSAWGDYSEKVFLLSWRDWALDERDEHFLDFLCWEQTRGPWPVGYADDFETMAQANDWRVNR